MKINVGTLLFERETGAVRVNRKGKRLTGKTRRTADVVAIETDTERARY